MNEKLNKKSYYYARVSSEDQNLNRQLDAFKELGANERDIIVDKASGKNMNRPGYRSLKHTLLRPGDDLTIVSLDRLSRNKIDIQRELSYFQKEKIRLKILDVPTTLLEPIEGQEWIMDMINNLLIEVLSSFSEKEREDIRKRQRQGIEAAKKRGKQFGRPSVSKPDNWEEVIITWLKNEITGREAMRRLNLKPSTFYKFVKEDNLL